MSENSVLISQCHLVDPSQEFDGTASILIEDGKVTSISKGKTALKAPKGVRTIDAKGCMFFLGWLMHVFIRRTR